MSCNTLTLIICGDVINVGFRRHVWRYAKLMNLRGLVVNVDEASCVSIYVEGSEESLKIFSEKIMSLTKSFNISNVDMILSKDSCKSFEDFEIYNYLKDLASSDKGFRLSKELEKILKTKCLI